MSDCFHCGLPVPPGGGPRAHVLGAERELCCTGCEAVARTIAAAGLESYYQTRSTPAAAPAGVPPPIRDWSGERREASLVLERVRCAACLWLIEQTLRRLPGVLSITVNYATQRAQVDWDPQRVRLPGIIEALRAVGYDAFPYEPQRHAESERRARRAELWRLFIAAFGAMQVMMYAFPAYVDDGALAPDMLQLMNWSGLIITTPVLLVSCRPFFAGALRELSLRRIGLDSPIALGIAGAFIASAWATVAGAGEVYFDSIAMLAFLLLGARFVESAARRRAAALLDPLLRWSQGRPAAVGQELIVAPGEQVPADGVVLAGSSSADESLLTGEARPVAKRACDELVGGSVNLEQPLTMRVTRTGADTRAAAIARLVERAAATRPRLVEAAERVARHLTWVVIAVAAGAWSWTGDPWIAVAVLVATCPCALALAAPIVLTRASAGLLQAGALLTRTQALEALERVTDVVFDKTGTLTTGRVSVAGREHACMDLARALEATSRHPIASAFQGHSAVQVDAPRHYPGRGVEGLVEGRRVRMGNEAFCRELCDWAPPAAGDVYLADERGWLAAFELADQVRPGAAALVASLKQGGLTVHLATGDRPERGAALAAALGIEHAQAAMTPEDKLALVERLQAQRRVVAMVGDGLNDTPVLARADVSFALGGGADAAKLRADVVLPGNRLEALAASMKVAKGAMRLVRQNLAWTLAYNALALPLAASGAIGPWEAALGMGLSSLIVLLNALRPLPGAQATWKASTSSFPSPSPSYS